MGEIDEVKCNGCERDVESCNCQYLIYAFNLTNEHLTNMGLLDRIAGYTLTTLIQKSIVQYVRDKCQGIFDKWHMKDLEKVNLALICLQNKAIKIMYVVARRNCTKMAHTHL